MNMQINPQVNRTDEEPEGLARLLPPRKYLIGGAALVLVLGGFWYVTNMNGQRAAAPNRAAPVKVAFAEKRNMAVIERTIGTVVANSTVSVTARVTGQLQAAHFKEGDLVKTGDLLFEIDPRPYQAALNQALAAQARDQAQLENAQNDARRYTTLFSQNAISTQQRDATQAAAKALEASVAADKAAADVARLNLEYSRIRSPVNGKTGPILVQPGNMITTGGAASTAPLVTINEIQPVKISFFLPQADLPRIQAMTKKGGLTATINLHDAGGDADIKAPVTFIGNAVNNTNGTIELRATFNNADASLVPGQLLDVVVALSEIPNAIVVPREAVNNGPEGQYVYRVTPDGIADQVEVKVLFDDTVNEAISGGIKDGDKVIIDGQLRVQPGAKVMIARARGPGAAGAGAGARRGAGKGGRGGGAKPGLGNGGD
jgi:multidrug efflux system membrane fusion protein